ncbi:cathepsin L-like [Diabrotica undecimpunctata]|uniref:cathepsin L-like n=1 Tax=Diabrotica undecimpunctata TaxID=50387 RepID=UPI003B63FEC3
MIELQPLPLLLQKISPNNALCYPESIKKKYNKNYKFRSVDNERYKIFQKNLRYIEEHNAERGLSTFEMGVTKFTDMTAEEFSQWVSRSKSNHNEFFSKSRLHTDSLHTDLILKANPPSEVDWRDAGAVTEVKDQDDCGSCWAFSATGGIEGAYFLKNKQLIKLSEQNLMDCDGRSSGCDGGLMTSAFDWILERGGVQTDIDYPYESRKKVCRFNNTKTTIPIVGYVNLPQGNEASLQNAVAQKPVCVGVHASRSMQFYKKGVMNDAYCCSGMGCLNHGMLIVGYGVDPAGIPYWCVKNSWGADWGMDGYIRMSRNKKNQCGIATLASYPIC